MEVRNQYGQCDAAKESVITRIQNELKKINFGSVTVVIHNGHAVQLNISTKERI